MVKRGPELSRLLEGPCPVTEVTTTNAHAAQLLHDRFPRYCGGGERAPACAESYPSLGLCLLRMCCALRNFQSRYMYDGVGSRGVPNPTLKLVISNKVWNVQFES